MGDDSVPVEDLRNRIREFVRERDWEQFHKPKDIAMSIGIEAGELLELFQWKTDNEIEEQLQDPSYKERLEDELADVVTFCLALANATGLDISTILENKLKKNHEKYPIEKSRGRATKYTEL